MEEAQRDPAADGNEAAYEDRLLAPILDRLAVCPLLSYEDGSEPETGLRMVPVLRWLGTPGVGHRLRLGEPVQGFVNRVGPTMDLDLCDRCGTAIRPEVSLCVASPPSIWVFRLCDPCIDELPGKLKCIPRS